MRDDIAEIDRNAAAHVGKTRTNERSDALGTLAAVSARQDDLVQQDRNKVDESRNRKQQGADDARQKAEAAAAKAAELARKAAEDNYRALELARDQEIQAGKLCAAADKASGKHTSVKSRRGRGSI